MNCTNKAGFLAPLLAVVVLGVAATATQAQVAGNIALTTKYKYRGQDQSDPTKNMLPAVQGGFDWSAGGFYLGNWNSSVGFVGGTEMDFYGGYKGEAGPLGYDVGLLYYYYPGTAVPKINTTEFYGALSWGPVAVKYSHNLQKYFGVPESKGTGYLELNLNYEVAKGLTLNGHWGSTRYPGDAKNLGAINYTDYKLGATYDLGSGFSLAGAFAGADKKAQYGDINKGRFIVTLTKTL